MPTLNEIRSVLKENNYTEEQVTAMNKQELKNAYEAIQDAKALLDMAVESENPVLEPIADQETLPEADNTPKMGDPEWSDYVLKMFSSDEIDNGNPKVDGLRRIAYKLLGPFNSETNVVQSPKFDQGATVVVRVSYKDPETRIERFIDGAADVTTGNTASPYCYHAVSTAETRAEGRALRKMLGLVKVLAAEEMQNATVDEPKGDDDRATSSAISTLKMTSEKVHVDLSKFCQFKFNKTSPVDLTMAEAREALNIIHAYKKGEQEIPEEVISL